MLLPYATKQAVRRTPWVTLALIAGSVLVTAVVATVPGALRALALLPDGLWTRQLFTYSFVHVSPSHLFANMAFLWLFGAHFENAAGRGQLVLLYLMAATAGAVGQFVFEQATVGSFGGAAGASAAVMALVALFLTRYRNTGLRVFHRLPGRPAGVWTMPAWWLAALRLAADGAYLALNLLGAASHMAYAAHAGGFAVGLLWAGALSIKRRTPAAEGD